MKSPENIPTPQSKEKEKLYMCDCCGFSTKKIEDLHEERKDGSITHNCPKHKNYNVPGPKQIWETRDEEMENAEKKYEVHYLRQDSIEVRDDCKKCKG